MTGQTSPAAGEVEQFNRLVPVGTQVIYWPGVRRGEGASSTTRSRAWVLGGHSPVVMVEGYPGGIALTHVWPVPQHLEAAGTGPEEQETGIQRLGRMLPALAGFNDPTSTEGRDVCAACGDCECGGACPAAMEVVRQVIDALGCGDDDWEWWIDYFLDEGVNIQRTEGGA